MSAEPYTYDEMTADVMSWQAATNQQKLAAFNELIALATADAFYQKDEDLIQRLRRMRATRDGNNS